MSKDDKRKSRGVLQRLIKKTVIFLLAFILPALLLIGCFNIKNTEVIGVKRYTSDQIKNIVYLTKPDHNSLYLYLKYKFFRQPQYPFIEKLDVEMVKPNAVKIYVYEKMVAGCVEFMGEYFYFDKDGIVVESSSKRLEKVPMIKGLKFNEIVLNRKLKVQKAELFDTIIHITQLIDQYGLGIDSVCFSSEYDITLECGNVTVLLGKKDTYDESLAELMNILKETKGMKITIDMRTNSIYAKPKK